MHLKKIKFWLVGLVLIFSCEKNEGDIVDQNLLIGNWRLQAVTFNEINGSEINDWISNSTAFSIGNDGRYYRNYVQGKWIMNNRKLILNPGKFSPNHYWEYEVLDLTKDVLKVRLFLTEGQYCCDFDQFEENEIISIMETYSRD